MHLIRLVLCVSLCGALSGQVSIAAGGGGGGGFAPGSGGGPDLNKIFREGTELLADGDCKKAERKFRTILKAVARNPEANYLRRVALQCQGNHKAAARYLKKAARYDEEMYAAYEKLGISYRALGNEKDAQHQLLELEALIRACVEKCPVKLLEAHASLASAIGGSDSDANDSAPKEPQSLLFDEVAEPRAAYLGAVQLINSERFEDAIKELRQLTRTIGPHPDVLNYLGYANRRLRLFDRAQAYYEQALAIDPLHRGANEYLGEMWVELGRLDEARRNLVNLDQACPFGCAEYEDLKRVIELRVVAAQ
jgi:tetratricopeptide (TPR) repeat protein